MAAVPGIVEYYNQTHLGYRLFWGLGRAHSMHYGLHDAAHAGHVDAVLNLIRHMAETADIGPTDHVLDVGCGFGGGSLWLAAKRGCRVTGLDINPREIAFARAQAERRGVADRVRFVEMDYTTMDHLERGAFSVVYQVETLIYADRRRFARDAFARLRPGGRLIVADYFASPAALAPADQQILDRWVRGWAGIDLITAGAFTGHLAEAGFADVRVEDVSAQVMPSSRRMARVCRLTAPLGRALELVGVRNRLQTENSIGAVLQYDALRRGLWVYGIVAARKP